MNFPEDDFVTCKNTGNEENGLHDVMGSMDDELRSTSIPKSFQDSSANQVGFCKQNIYKVQHFCKSEFIYKKSFRSIHPVSSNPSLFSLFAPHHKPKQKTFERNGLSHFPVLEN